MSIKIPLIGIFILSVISSCTKDNQVEKLKSEVMTIHDEVTPDEAMMQWMRTYKDPSEEMSKEAAMEYLEMKKKEILEVKEKIKASESRAKKALQN